MNIEKLEYLNEVVATGSISKAAQNLHVTVSTISQAISNLEAEWDVILLNRTRSGIAPTSEGLIIIKKITELLAKYAELKETVQSFTNTVKGNLRLATIPGQINLLENAVVEFKKEYPDFQMEIIEKGSHDIIKDILHNRCDLGFIILHKNRALDSTRISVERLHKVRMVAAVSKESPLALKKSITLEEMIQQKIVLYNDDYFKWFVDELQEKYGNIDVLFTTNNRQSIFRAIHNQSAITIGLYYSFLGASPSIQEEIALLNIDLPAEEPIYLGLIKAEGKNFTRISRTFVKQLKQILSEFFVSNKSI